MASELQIAANRLNAQSSSGPRTEEGKARSRMNAVKHGLTAQAGLLAHEDPGEFASLSEAVMAEFRPGSALEDELVERIASVLWRLRRVPAFEAGLFGLGRGLPEKTEPSRNSLSRSIWRPGCPVRCPR